MVRKAYTDACLFHEQNAQLGTKLPYSENTSILASALCDGSKTIQNRLACQTLEGCDGTPTGEPDVLTKRRYDRFAKGGAGLIWFEATAVTEEERKGKSPASVYS